jgi:hypothetical protein
MPTFPIKGLVLISVAAGLCPAYAQSASENRPVASFSRISAQGGIDVHLRQAAEPSLRVEVEGYALDDVVTEVVDEELRLYRDGPALSGFFGGQQIRVYLDVVELSAVEASGGSDIESRSALELDGLVVRASGGSDIDLDVQAASLEITLSGGSDADLRGSAASLTVEASGGSDVSARSLDADRVALRISGGSDASVQARESVDIDAHGGSDVEVYGAPDERRVDNDRSSDVAFR